MQAFDFWILDFGLGAIPIPDKYRLTGTVAANPKSKI
jgi:hypothetical protein